VPNNVAEKDPSQEQAQEYREALSDAYVFIESQKATQSFAALTPEDCYAAFIERVEGSGSQLRPSALERIEKLRQGVHAAIAKVRDIPPENFRTPEPENDVNSPV
jgi:hypothetical protein